MLKRLRRKFIAINMTIVTLMLLVIFGLVIHFTQTNLENQSIQMMHSVAENPGFLGHPGEQKGEVRLPFFTVRVTDDGQVIATGHEFYDLTDEEFLLELVELAQESGEITGVLEDYDLRFFRAMMDHGPKDEGGVFFVFADTSSESDTMLSLYRTCVEIGLLAFLAFWLLSIFLSRWAIRPVEEAWTQQKQFVADASHELKTPLTVITTNAELLRSPEYGPEEKQNFTDAILTMSRQMRGLVEGLLDLARVDNGVAQSAAETFSLSQLVEEAMLPFEAVFFERGLVLTGDVAEGIRVKGSSSHLKQVVDVLLDNAQKYSHPNTEVTVRLARAGRGSCVLSITNHGDTIPKEDLKNIFKRFYRVDKVRTMNHSYGLGLSIAERIVHDHHGTIRAESENGVNVFTVQLPIL